MEADTVHVAVGVVLNSQGQVLIARRNQDSHQGGLWEFPGGKVEPDETVEEALRRELLEEVHVRVEDGTSLLAVEYDYGDKRVLLDVWLIQHYSGQAAGREGQPVCWVDIDKLDNYAFPRANAAILDRLRAL